MAKLAAAGSLDPAFRRARSFVRSLSAGAESLLYRKPLLLIAIVSAGPRPSSRRAEDGEVNNYLFSATTSIDAQVLLRIPGLGAQRDAVPSSILCMRRPRSLVIKVVVDALAVEAAGITLQKIPSLVSVRSARLSWAGGRIT